MSKTPEELALEYAHQVQLFWDGGPLDHHIVVLKEMAFLAGYKAAQETYKQEIRELKEELKDYYAKSEAL